MGKFTLQPWPSNDINGPGGAFALPSLPNGMGYTSWYSFREYFELVRSGDYTAENANKALSVISGCEGAAFHHMAAKLAMLMHSLFPGLDGDTLLIINKMTDGQRGLFESLFADLIRQIPTDWNAAREEYEAALALERAYDREVYHPAVAADGRNISAEIEEEVERRTSVRIRARDALLDMPAQSLEHFACKYLICFDGDNGMEGWHDDLVADAKRLLGGEAAA